MDFVSGPLCLLLFIAPLAIYGYVRVPKFVASKSFQDLSNAFRVVASLLFTNGADGGRGLLFDLAGRLAVAVSGKLLDSFVPIQLGYVVDRITNSASTDPAFPWRDILVLSALSLLA